LETTEEKLGKEQLRREARLLAGVLLNGARVAFALLLLVLADRVAAGRLSSDTAVAVAGLAAAALVVLVLSPGLARALSRRVSKISLGPVALEVFQAAEKVTPSVPTEDPEDSDALVTSVLALRLKIERKLTYIAKHVLDDKAGHPTFLTIGSLKYDKLLPGEEADVVNRLMTLRDEDLDGLPVAEKDEFLGAADKIARNIRASVLHGLVWQLLQQLKADDGEWAVRKIRRGAGKRADLLAEKGGRKYRIAPVFATDEESELLDKARKRLRPGEKTTVARRIVVLPHCSDSPESPDDDPAVLTTDGLCKTLKKLSMEAPAAEASGDGRAAPATS
jgi:hypothetical protein